MNCNDGIHLDILFDFNGYNKVLFLFTKGT